MAEASTKKYAVVTGANKGLGLEICRQLASNGIVVVLTARNEKRGLEAVQKLKDSGISGDLVYFHQLDVADPTTLPPLAHFIKTHFGKLDILVNNAGVPGTIMDVDGMIAAGIGKEGVQINYADFMKQTLELAEETVQINYYGTKRTVELLLPFLQLSDSPRIVNISSITGKLENIPNEWAKGILSDLENLTEERVEEVLSEFLKDFRAGSLENKGWPASLSGYILSKASVTAYTRILAKRYPNFCVNCVCPGYIKTDMNHNSGTVPIEEGAEGPVKLALLPNGGPSGRFFFQKEESGF